MQYVESQFHKQKSEEIIAYCTNETNLIIELDKNI